MVLVEGAIGDGQPHKLSTMYPTLAAAQVDFPDADDLTPERDGMALQKAIDDAFTAGYSAIRMPDAAKLLTSSTIFLDPPVSLRNKPNLPRWSAGNTYTKGAVVLYNGVPKISLQDKNGGNTPYLKVSDDVIDDPWWQDYYTGPSGSFLRPALNALQTWKPFLQGEPGQQDVTGVYGTVIRPQFINARALIMGPNNGGAADSFCVAYPTPPVGFGGSNPFGCGVTIVGAGGGASRTRFTDVYSVNGYTAFEIPGVPRGGLGDNNQFVNCGGAYTYQFLNIGDSQAYVNTIESCQSSSTVGVVGGRSVLTTGGNWSALEEGSPAAAFPIENTSRFYDGSEGQNGYWQFGSTFYAGAQYLMVDTLVPQPDLALRASAYADARTGVYTWFTIVTPSFGPIPFIPRGFNKTTTRLTLMLAPPFVDMWLAGAAPTAAALQGLSKQLQVEIQEATKIYAASPVFPFQTTGTFISPFFENANTAMCLFSGSGYGPAKIVGMYNDADPSLPYFAPNNPWGNVPNDFQLAHYYAQRTMPYIHLGGCSLLTIDNATIGSASKDPLIVYQSAGSYSKLCYRDSSTQGVSSGAPAYVSWFPGNPAGPLYTNYSSPPSASTPLEYMWEANCTPNIPTWNNQYGSSAAKNFMLQDRPMQGIRPSKSSVPEVLADGYNVLSATPLPPIVSPELDGSRAVCPYPLLFGGATYQVSYLSPDMATQYGVDPAYSKLIRSGHSFYSYHQDLTAANVAGLSWSVRGQSNCLKLDSNSITFMFVGLKIGLITDKLDWYLVLEVIPGIGLVKLYRIAAERYTEQAFVSGDPGTVYAGTVIQQEPLQLTVL